MCVCAWGGQEEGTCAPDVRWARGRWQVAKSRGDGVTARWYHPYALVRSRAAGSDRGERCAPPSHRH
eukprot:1318783-Prymnesium_polylepis.1